MSDSNKSTEIVGSSFNIKLVIGKLLAFLPFVLFSLFISLFVAYLANRYATPRYLIKSSILIKEKGGLKNQFDGADNFLSGMSLLNQSKNLENEMGILVSRSLVTKTLEKLDFKFDYFSLGSGKRTNIYGKSPFIITLDSSHLQCYDMEI